VYIHNRNNGFSKVYRGYCIHIPVHWIWFRYRGTKFGSARFSSIEPSWKCLSVDSHWRTALVSLYGFGYTEFPGFP